MKELFEKMIEAIEELKKNIASGEEMLAVLELEKQIKSTEQIFSRRL